LVLQKRKHCLFVLRELDDSASISTFLLTLLQLRVKRKHPTTAFSGPLHQPVLFQLHQLVIGLSAEDKIALIVLICRIRARSQ
jgi:hypothetical protein